MPGGIRSGRVRIDDELEIHYEASGDGDRVLLFVPGWSMSTRVFDAQLRHFEGSRTYRFVTYDPRGQGRSTKTRGGHFYEQHGRDLERFTRALGIEDFVLAGWSFGVLDALCYVDAFGADALAGLVMLDGPPRSRGEDAATEWVSYQHGDPDGREAFYTLGPLRDRAAMNDAFARWMLEDPSDENVRFIADIADQTPPEVAALLNATGAFADHRGLLARLDAELPLLFVLSEENEPPARAWADRHAPRATVVGLGKHLMFRERAAEFHAILERFAADVWNAR